MKFNRRFITAIIFMICFLCIISCTEDKSKNIPDVSDIEVQFQINRYDRALYNADTVHWDSSWTALKEQYPAFSSLYAGEVLGFGGGNTGDSTVSRQLESYITAPQVRGLFDTVQSVYPRDGLSQIEDQFRQSFRYYRHYFPDKEVPDIYTFVSEFTLATFIFQQENGKDALATGLDFFLGDEFAYEKINLPGGTFSSYISRTFNRDHLVKKTLDALIDDLLGSVPRSDLLHQMIYHGKRVYITDRLLPHASDSVVMEYTPEDLEWCRNNEKNIWSYFLSNDLLYSEEWSKTRAYLQPAPHSRGMPPEAPGRTGIWLGWQIIEQFMKRNPEISMDELISMNDAQHILDASKYKPRR